MKYSIEIGEYKFSSKKEALLHYKTILNSYELDEKLNDIDFEYVLSLLKTHPKVDEKIGIGIKLIRIRKLKKYNVRSFQLVRKDNSTDFFLI